MPNVEIYLCEKKYFSKNFKGKIVIDLHFFEPSPRKSKIKISNNQAEKMIKRTIPILPTWLIYPMYLAYLYSRFDRKHIVKNLSSNKDPLGLLDKYNNHFSFTKEEKLKGKQILKKFNLNDNDKFVCLNIRDSSYLKKTFPTVDFSYHDYRDLNIDIFELAIDLLLKKGFTVFRVGKTSNQSLNIKHQNYIDITNLEYDDFLDIYLGANCEFCITSSSGFDATSYVFRRKILYIQVPISHFFSSSKRHFISTRYHKCTKTGKILRLKEIFQKNVHNADTSMKFVQKNIELISPSKNEIKEIVLEALQYFSNDFQTKNNVSQIKFWKIYKSMISSDKQLINFHEVIKAHFSEIQLNKIL